MSHFFAWFSCLSVVSWASAAGLPQHPQSSINEANGDRTAAESQKSYPPAKQEAKKDVHAVLPTANDGRPSLLKFFQGGRPQDFAGEGTTYPPECNLDGGTLTITVAGGYRGYAGCYVELASAINLSAFKEGVLRVELAKPASRLEIKLESGPAGKGRGELWLYRATAAKGRHEYTIPAETTPVIAATRRLVIAIAGEPSGDNVITVYRSWPATGILSR